MQFNCPSCGLPLSDPELICANSHKYKVENGIVRLVSAEFQAKLTDFLPKFEAMRAAGGRRIINSAQYEQLPHVLAHDDEWKQRIFDLEIVEQALHNRANQSVLEIGAWNGWLSNRLTQMGHTVTAVDEFVDTFDGLGAHIHYAASWLPVQADTRNLGVFTNAYDIVVLNRCVQFFLDPLGYVKQAQTKVKQGGILLLLGLAFFKKPARKKAAVAENYAQLATQGMELFKPNKGYLDFDDLRGMQKYGVRMTKYHQRRMWLANMRAWVQPERPIHFWGSYQHT